MSDHEQQQQQQQAVDKEDEEENLLLSPQDAVPSSSSVFPCIEQPQRVTLHCNGYYLWGLRNGRVIARKKRSERDEFCLEYMQDGTAMVQITNHKFQSKLGAILQADGTRKVACIKQPTTTTAAEDKVGKEDEETEQAKPTTPAAASPTTHTANGDSFLNDDALTEEELEGHKESSSYTTSSKKNPKKFTAILQSASEDALDDDDEPDEYKGNDNMEEEEEAEEALPAMTVTSDNVAEEDLQWVFVEGANGRTLLKSLATGENLGLDAKGNLVFVAKPNEEAVPNIHCYWDVECVKGELCFLSNERLDTRIRCDMAGLLGLTDAWKGWEVFRFMEASHGYVKIASWMHSQWLLCSMADGTVTTCSHAESFVHKEQQQESAQGIDADTNGHPTTTDTDDGNDNTKKNNNKNAIKCSKWAIEKSPRGNGVIIRSKTFGRLLSVHEGVLKTYNDGSDDNEDAGPVDWSNWNQPEEDKEDENSNKTKWWNNRAAMTSSMRNSMKQWQGRLSNSSNNKSNKESGEEDENGEKNTDTLTQQQPRPPPAQEETVVWHLEAAHSQTYYFISAIANEAPKSIGPMPQVTPNLRQTEKIQLLRQGTRTKLYLVEKKQYIACTSTGDIVLIDDTKDAVAAAKEDSNAISTEWLMEKPPYQEGGSVFRSKVYHYYLSYHTTTTTPPDDQVDENGTTTFRQQQLKRLLGKSSKQRITKLVGSELLEEQVVWNLQPCMPRAVSSEKIKTFALGTGIAVGTTIAMPFALAGVGAILGAAGAQVGIVANAIAVGLTGAEALASVGAIGATAYIVFRPEENSLTDNHTKEEEEEDERKAEAEWSKRPFSNWREW